MNPTIRPPRATAMIRAVLLVLFLVAGAGSLAEAQEAAAPPARTDSGPDARPPTPGLSPEQTAKNVESFEVVWKTVRDSYYDPKFGGLDWQAVHDELRPKVERARSNAEARDLMAQAIDRLGQSHFAIIPSELEPDLDNPRSGSGEVGLEVRLIDGKAVVSSVREGSAAAEAGVKPGWVVVKAAGKPVPELLDAVAKAYARSRALVPAYQAHTVARWLRGRVGASVGVDFLDGKDRPEHRDLTAREPGGVAAQFGHLPTMHVRFETRRIDRTVAYASLNVFFDAAGVIRQFGELIEAGHDADGLILDVRGNPGGLGVMSMAMGGWLVKKPGLKLGTMTMRTGTLNFMLIPRPRAFEKPVAVLVDELSMSTSEILAGGLKDLGRVRIFGTRTPGAALPSMVVALPNGDRFQYAIGNYISVGGKPLEGIGVVPDVEAPPTRAALLEGRDPALEAAVRWIRAGGARP